MEQKKQTVRRSREETKPVEAASHGGAGNLMSQVEGWAGVAREAHEDCEKGEEAIKKVRLRRNKSGE